MHQAVQQGPPASWGPSCTLGLKAYDAQSRLTSGASDAATAATAATRAAAPPPRASVAPATAAAAAAAGASWLRKCPVCCCSLAACACDAAAIAAEHRRQQQQQQLVHQRRQQLQQQREQLERVNSIQQQQKMLLQQQLNSNDEEDPPLVYPGGPLVSCSYQKRGTDAAAPRGPLTGSGVSWSGGAVSSWQQQQQWPQQQQQRQQLQGRGRSAAAAGSSITGEIQGLLGPRVLAACNQLQQQHQQGSDKAPLEDLMLYKVSPSRSTAAAVAAAVIGATAAPKTVVAAAAAPALCPSWSLQGTGEAPSSSSSSNNNNNREQQLSDCQVALQCLGISQRRQGDRKREGDRETKESLQPSLEAQRSFFSSNWLPGTQQPLAATNTNAAAAAAAAEGAEVQYLPHEARRSPVSPSRQQPAATAAEGLCEPPSSRETAEDRDEGIWQETPQGRRALRAYLIELQTRLAAAEQQATHNFVGCLYREIHLQGLSQQQLLPQGALTVGEPLAEGGPSGSSPDGAGRETQEAADSAKEQQQQLMLLQQQLRLLSSEREASASV
ncbi:hypothetical protein, conserved [Eimeria acervulina]|uniref:Uncharacterized protein n=1 Tax=Eimeria acervulina TaxID=5801 RepID=U6GVY4_EIMAC|nr:hypothetical protein, conserved [Eimeria acervulina]CDI84416.1 hypothetical protein, conserved [Eimeria acervulina]